MSFKLPKSVTKSMRSANFEFLIPVTLNETNLERMLIQILERMVKGGKTSPPHNGDKDTALRYQELLTELQNNPKLKGFGSDKGRSVLDGWLRTSIVEMIPVSKSKSGEQIDYLRLLSVASYRSGLPKWRSRNRKTDATIYASLCNALPSKPEVSAESLRRILEATDLTTGIEFPQLSYPWKDPEYSGQEKVDISALLEMRFLEGVNAKEPKLEPESGKDVAIPELFDPLGREMLEILLQFGNWSTGELTSSLTSIMALRLFQVPIRASSRIGRDLAGIQGGQEEDIEMYFDFTNLRGSESDLLARRSLQHDLQLVATLFPKLVLLREVDNSVKRISHLNESFKALPGSEKYQQLLQLVNDPSVHGHAGYKLGDIDDAFQAELGDSPSYEDFDRIRSESENDLVALQKVLVADHGQVALAGYRKWLYSTGGLTSSGIRRDYAIIEGTMSKSSTWKYSMSDSVLHTVINLCFLDDNGRLQVNKNLEMSLLLKRLRERFGILIDIPPSYANDSAAHQATVENLEAFKRSLKLLGYFQGLSDDFSAQYVTRSEVGKK